MTPARIRAQKKLLIWYQVASTTGSQKAGMHALSISGPPKSFRGLYSPEVELDYSFRLTCRKGNVKIRLTYLMEVERLSRT